MEIINPSKLIKDYFLKKHIRKTISICLSYILKTGLVITVPLLTKQVIDSVIPLNEVSVLLKWVTVIFLAQILLIGVGLLNTYLANVFKFGFTNWFRLILLDKVLNSQWDPLLDRGTGYLVGRIENDIDGLSKFYVEDSLTLLYSIFTLVITTYLVFTFNARLAISFLISLPAFGISLKLFNKGMKERTDAVQEERSVSTSQVTEIVAGRDEIKALGAEDTFLGIYTKRLRNYFKAIISRYLYSCKPAVLGQLSSALGKVALVGVGGYEIIHSRLSFGEFFAFSMLMAYIFTSVGQLVNINISLQTGLGCYKRIKAMFSLPQVCNSGRRIERIESICFEGVAFKYPTYEQAFELDDINLSVEKGQVLALAGRSGSGKTTIFKLLQKLFLSREGVIRINDTPIQEIANDSYCENLSVVQQEPFLFSISIYDNLTLGVSNASMDQVIEVCKIANIHNFIEDLPGGYAHILNERGTNLSGGQKQRIAISRSLLRNTSLLLLDEATTGLDSENIKTIHKAVSNSKADRITVIIGHSREAMLIADKILLLDEGRAVAYGPHSTLENTCNLYRTLFAEFKEMEEINEHGNN
jgi:ABC-type multidrug transport system fused ATPase/permease subunit